MKTRSVKILSQPRHSVKALVIAAGLSLGELAKAAGIPQSTLSFYLHGRSRNHAKQILIWQAYCHITDSHATLAEFWGDMLSERIAG